MAQKKVILKDGSDDLLPKTLASMVFTEAGQTVEAALQNAGGGGSSSGGGTGNVNVTNGSGLQKDAYYAFQPSAAGSLTGKFATLPYASSTAAGLMSPSNYDKLDAIKEERELPSSVVSLSSSSTELEVQKAMYELIGGTWSDIEGNDNIKLIVALYWGAFIQNVAGFAIDYTYNHSRISLVPTYTPPASGEGNQYEKASLELTYVSSGKLRTVTLTATLNSSGDTATYDFTAEVEESGDDTYFLGSDLINLETNSTHEDILAAFGGNLDGIIGALKAKKKIFVFFSSLGIFNSISPVSAFNTGSFLISVFFPVNNVSDIHFKNVICSASNSDQSRVHNIYPSGYPLKPSLYSLTSSSTTDEISTAVGGESGLKEIIQAVKDGNRLVIRGAYSDQIPITSSTEVISVGYNEGENGDMQLFLSYWVYISIGATHKILAINYTKSSNTFAVSASQDIS